MKSDFSGHEAELYQSIVDLYRVSAIEASAAQKKSDTVEQKLNELDFSNDATKKFFLKQTKLSEQNLQQYSPLEHLIFAALGHNPSNQACMVVYSNPLLLLLKKVDFQALDLQHAKETILFASMNLSDASHKTPVSEAVSALKDKLALLEPNKRRKTAETEDKVLTAAEVEARMKKLQDKIARSQAELKHLESTIARMEGREPSSSTILHSKRRYDEMMKETSPVHTPNSTPNSTPQVAEEENMREDLLEAEATDNMEQKTRWCTIS